MPSCVTRRRAWHADLAAVTVLSHRRILDRLWRPRLGTLPLIGVPYSLLVQIADAYPVNKKTYNNAVPCAGPLSSAIGTIRTSTIPPRPLRPSEEIALLVSDYDATHGVLNITKARVNGIDQEVTKTGEDRRILLCPRAVAILERHLQLRAQWVRSGRIHHDGLFFTNSGAPIPHVNYGHRRWQRTLKRLPIRYRKPYGARHTCVSWNLMIGRNPLLVAKEHGHRLTTMLTVYAAWAEGAVESDSATIREAMHRTDRPAVTITERALADRHAGRRLWDPAPPALVTVRIRRVDPN